MDKTIHKLIACSIIVSTLLVSGSFADEVDESVKVVLVKSVSAYTQAELSRDAAKVMLSVANAREDIYHKDVKQAKEALQKALVQIKIIDNLRPTKAIIEHVEVAKKHLDYEATQEVGQDLIPIAYDINQLALLVPTKNAQKHLANAKKAIALGDKKGAKKELEALEKAVNITVLYLPVNETKENIYKALTALDLGKLKQANSLLKKAENSLVIMSVASVRPVAKAKKSFYNAMVDYSHGEYVKAKEDLHQSELWLDKAMHSLDTKTRDEAKKLKEKTSFLENNLSKSTTDAEAKIHALWAQSKVLSQKDADSIASKYNSSKKEVAIKSDLLDAKLHVEYAEIKQFVYGTKKDVNEELQKAKVSLKKASQYADAKTATSIKVVDTSIDKLEKDTKESSADIKAKYNQVRIKIDKLIHQF
jgi:cellobiose-specific phosphotransferase system component IIA